MVYYGIVWVPHGTVPRCTVVLELWAGISCICVAVLHAKMMVYYVHGLQVNRLTL